MIGDAFLVLADQQAITVTAASQNVIDQIAAGDPGRAAFLYIQTDESFAASGSGTLTIDLQTSSDNSTWTTLWSSGAVAKTTLVGTVGAEYELKIAIPRGALRYLRLNNTVATGPFTAGKLTALIVLDVDLAV